MKHLLLLATLILGSISFSQRTGDIAIFSNTGDQFYVVLNGIRQNDKPETNVKVTGLAGQAYKAKIISANNNFTLDKNIYVQFDTLTTYQIVERKGKYKLRYFSSTSLGTATTDPSQTVVGYHATENTNTNTNISTNNGVVEENVTTTIDNGGTGMTTTTTTTTMSTTENVGTGTTINNGNGTETVNMDVNVGGFNMDVNVSGTGIPQENVNVNSNSSSSTTTTTTSSSTSSGMNGTYYEESSTTTTTSTTNNGTTTYYEETSTTTTSGNGGGNVVTTTTYNNNTNEGNLYQDQDMTVTFDNNNCMMNDADFNAASESVKAKSFSDSKMTLAKQITKNNCLSAQQVKSIMKLFDFEDDRLEYAKFAYDYTYDVNNYYQVNDAFEFESSIEELEQYIQSRR